MVGKCSVWLDSYVREETFVVNLFFLGGGIDDLFADRA